MKKITTILILTAILLFASACTSDTVVPPAPTGVTQAPTATEPEPTEAPTQAPLTGPVKLYDDVIVDYVGTIRKVKFIGGSANEANLIIGSGKHIPALEKGIIGMKPGDTKDISVTIPKDFYEDKDLAGETAVFKVTLKLIVPPRELKDGPVTKDDSVNLSLSAKMDGKEIKDFEVKWFDYNIGSGINDYYPGIEEKIIGMKSGETKDISVVMPDDSDGQEDHEEEEKYAGKTIVFTVTVNRIYK